MKYNYRPNPTTSRLVVILKGFQSVLNTNTDSSHFFQRTLVVSFLISYDNNIQKQCMTRNLKESNSTTTIINKASVSPYRIARTDVERITFFQSVYVRKTYVVIRGMSTHVRFMSVYRLFYPSTTVRSGRKF